MAMTVLVSGASGLIGTPLTERLSSAGYDVLKLVRRRPTSPDEVNWAPSAHTVDFSVMDRVDAVINLSGASLSHLPWTSAYKRQILESRTTSTQTIVDAINMARTPPKVLLSASAVGFYGDRPGERLTEESPRGTGFLSDVVVAWERIAAIAHTDTRVVALRTGVVLAKGGGALAPLLPLTRLGLGSRLGTGGQHWPWISLHDEVEAIVHLLESQLSGPVNLVGPTPATSDRITAALAERLHRWYAFTVPEAVVKLGMGEAGEELLLSSQKVLPQQLLKDGFVFRHERVEDALDAALVG